MSRSDYLDNCDWIVNSNDTDSFYVIVYILPQGGRSYLIYVMTHCDCHFQF